MVNMREGRRTREREREREWEKERDGERERERERERKRNHRHAHPYTWVPSSNHIAPRTTAGEVNSDYLGVAAPFEI